MCFIEDGNILITSSGKENAFYIWKYEENESEDNEESDWKFVLKNTLKKTYILGLELNLWKNIK